MAVVGGTGPAGCLLRAALQGLIIIFSWSTSLEGGNLSGYGYETASVKLRKWTSVKPCRVVSKEGDEAGEVRHSYGCR